MAPLGAARPGAATWLPGIALFAGLSLAHAAASAPAYRLEIRDWVVDYLRPTVLPRESPYEVPAGAKLWAALANDSSPGPTLEAFEGEPFEVAVVNQLLGSQVDFVWEGVEVESAPPKPLPQQGGEFVYRLRPRSAGTFSWRSSSPLQATAGLKGALVVRSRKDPSAHLYQEERIVTLADALQRPEVCVAPDGSLLPGCPELDQLTVDGQFGDGSKRYPYRAIEVSAGRCYRLRWLSLTTATPTGSHIEVSIASHDFRVISGKATEKKVDSFTVASGGATDVVLCADQHPGPFDSKDFPVALIYRSQTFSKPFSAILRYVGGAHSAPVRVATAAAAAADGDAAEASVPRKLGSSEGESLDFVGGDEGGGIVV